MRKSDLQASLPERCFVVFCLPSAIQPAPPALLPALPQLPAADMSGEASIAADPSMDMFSLGVLAWEVMTGKRFFGGGCDCGWG